MLREKKEINVEAGCRLPPEQFQVVREVIDRVLELTTLPRP